MKKFALTLTITVFSIMGTAMACQDFSGTYELNGCQGERGKSTTIRIFDLKTDYRIGHYTRINIKQTKCKKLVIEYGERVKTYKIGRESYLSPYNAFLRDSISTKLKKNFIVMKKKSGDLIFRDVSKMTISKTDEGLTFVGDYVFRGYMTGKEDWSTTCKALKI